MDKPIQLAIEETKIKLNRDIVKIINESGLPVCCINPLLKDVYNSCLELERQQLEEARFNYAKQQEINKTTDINKVDADANKDVSE